MKKSELRKAIKELIIQESKPKELIQNAEWNKTHSKGIGWYATVRARPKKDGDNSKGNDRFFIDSTSNVQKFLGNKWNVWAV